MKIHRIDETKTQEISFDAQNARIVVYITFHYRQDRLRYLFDVIKSLGEFPIAAMDIVVVTNVSNGEQVEAIRTLGARILSAGKSLDFLIVSNLEHPFDLTWSHKPRMKTDFLDKEKNYTHFIYMEDDIRFTYSNFIYFLTYDNLLSEFGLIPSFIRYEYNYTLDDICLSDHMGPVVYNGRSEVDIGELRFMNTEYPYMAMFIMNREHAAEYISSMSFDKDLSVNVHPWWIAERAAMGLTWERVPDGFSSRYVIPILHGQPLGECYIHHLPNNYTNDYGDQRRGLAKLTPDKAFIPSIPK